MWECVLHKAHCRQGARKQGGADERWFFLQPISVLASAGWLTALWAAQPTIHINLPDTCGFFLKRRKRQNLSREECFPVPTRMTQKSDDSITCTRTWSRSSPVQWGGKKYCCSRHVVMLAGGYEPDTCTVIGTKKTSETGILSGTFFVFFRAVISRETLSISWKHPVSVCGGVGRKSCAVFEWPRGRLNTNTPQQTVGACPPYSQDVFRYWSPRQWRPNLSPQVAF